MSNSQYFCNILSKCSFQTYFYNGPYEHCDFPQRAGKLCLNPWPQTVRWQKYTFPYVFVVLFQAPSYYFVGFAHVIISLLLFFAHFNIHSPLNHLYVHHTLLIVLSFPIHVSFFLFSVYQIYLFCNKFVCWTSKVARVLMAMTVITIMNLAFSQMLAGDMSVLQGARERHEGHND